MPQERIEWTCPTCNKRYAIPASANLPAQCPSCQKAVPPMKESAPAPVVVSSPPPVIPPIITETSFPNVGEVHIDSAIGDIPLAANNPVKQRKQSRRKTTSRKYPALRTISLAYRILAILLAVATILVNTEWSIGILKLADYKLSGSTLYYFIVTNMGILLAGCFLVLFSYAASELIFLFIDVEGNTRQQREE